ncbi:hypothetical protein BDZ89DRAFT_1129923 [Hymenopellis radicata]|nr:hypothetical protein BDZ89DRAFT_1129923 [Hymenopellis radicata]
MATFNVSARYWEAGQRWTAGEYCSLPFSDNYGRQIIVTYYCLATHYSDARTAPSQAPGLWQMISR